MTDLHPFAAAARADRKRSARKATKESTFGAAMAARMMCRPKYLWVMLPFFVSAAAGCGNGEPKSWSALLGTKQYCCSSVPVTRWSYSVNGGTHEDSIQFRIVTYYDKSSYYPSSKCNVYDNGSRCTGDACVSSYNNDCSDTGSITSAERLCLEMDCNNLFYNCDVRSYTVSFYNPSPAPTSAPTSAPTYAPTSAPTSSQTSAGTCRDISRSDCTDLCGSNLAYSSSSVNGFTVRTCTCSGTKNNGQTFQKGSPNCPPEYTDSSPAPTSAPTSSSCSYHYSCGSSEYCPTYGTCSNCYYCHYFGNAYNGACPSKCSSYAWAAPTSAPTSAPTYAPTSAPTASSFAPTTSYSTDQSCKCYCCKGNYCSQQLVASWAATSSSSCTSNSCRNQFSSVCPASGESGKVAVSYVSSSYTTSPSVDENEKEDNTVMIVIVCNIVVVVVVVVAIGGTTLYFARSKISSFCSSNGASTNATGGDVENTIEMPAVVGVPANTPQEAPGVQMQAADVSATTMPSGGPSPPAAPDIKAAPQPSAPAAPQPPRPDAGAPTTSVAVPWTVPEGVAPGTQMMVPLPPELGFAPGTGIPVTIPPNAQPGSLLYFDVAKPA